MKIGYAEVLAYITKDGSVIRELMHPKNSTLGTQSLAEARIPANGTTLLHRHELTEEIYHVTQGCGEMTFAEKCFAIKVGDTIRIPPGTAHRLKNTGTEELVVLCCCSPAYSHADTYLL